MGMVVAGMIIGSYCGSFPHYLRLAQVSFWGYPLVIQHSHGIAGP